MSLNLIEENVIVKLKLKGHICHLEQGKESRQRNERGAGTGWRSLGSKASLPEAFFTGFGLTVHSGDSWGNSIKGSSQVGTGLGSDHYLIFLFFVFAYQMSGYLR